MYIKPELIAVIDTETTGVGKTDEVLQIAIINGSFKKILNQYFKPANHTSWCDAQAVNNISPYMVRNCKPVADHREELQKLVDGYKYILGYNVDFDIRMLKELDFSKHIVVDVIKMARYYLKDEPALPSKKLTAVAEYFGFRYDKMNAHNAYTDVIATMYVYIAIMKQFRPTDEEFDKFIIRPKEK